MSNIKHDYIIENIDLENNTMTLKRYNNKTKMEVIIKCKESATTETKWKEFWNLFERNEARKIMLKSKATL